MKRLLVLAAVALLASCSRGTKEEAERAVRIYLARLVDAYRTSDASLVDPLVNERQGLRLTGLIGVKRDAGVVLDGKLLEIEFTRVEREGAHWVAETKERWYYRDRKIGTGEQVGEDSTDSYEMRYTFSRKDGRLILEDVTFAGRPVVGRKTAPMPVDPKVLHGLAPRGEQGGMPPGHPSAHGAPAGPERRP